jgi:hypothetical protein
MKNDFCDYIVHIFLDLIWFTEQHHVLCIQEKRENLLTYKIIPSLPSGTDYPVLKEIQKVCCDLAVFKLKIST